jgi:hypothetical protein
MLFFRSGFPIQILELFLLSLFCSYLPLHFISIRTSAEQQKLQSRSLVCIEPRPDDRRIVVRFPAGAGDLSDLQNVQSISGSHQVNHYTFKDEDKWKYLFIQHSPISQRALLRGRFPCFTRWPFWSERHVDEYECGAWVEYKWRRKMKVLL